MQSRLFSALNNKKPDNRGINHAFLCQPSQSGKGPVNRLSLIKGIVPGGGWGVDMSEMTVNETAQAPAPTEESKQVIHKIWPAAVVVVGLGFTVAWVIVLGYGLVKIIGAAI